jgi:hypothetical protein
MVKNHSPEDRSDFSMTCNNYQLIDLRIKINAYSEKSDNFLI